MRIVHLCRSGWPAVGGMEAVVDGLSQAQVGLGHRVSVVTLDHTPGGKLLSEGDRYGIPYHRVPRLGPRRYPFAQGLLPLLEGADVVHTHGLDGLTDQAVVLKTRHGARVGVSTHGGYFHTPRHRWLKGLWLRTLTRYTLGHADAVWFTSAADAARMPGISGEVVENGVDVQRFAAVQRRPEPGQWLAFGRVDVHKGLDDLVPLLPSGVTLHVVGAEARPGLAERLRGPQVRVHGALGHSDLLELMGRCELALFPSRYEGFGLAAVELMGAGVPVVLSAIPAFDALGGGYRVDFRARPSLESLLGADHSAMVAAGAEVAARHAWPVRVHAFERAYRALGQPR